MVQNKKPRGRPRAYDPDTALKSAMEVFWSKGFAATSLDDLASAMNMNRPSLYAAFGDKRALYRKALARYRELSRAGMQAALAEDQPLRQALERYFRIGIDLYFAPENGGRGCFIIGTALTEAATDPELGKDLLAGLERRDKALEARIRLGMARGEVASTATPGQLATLVTGTLYSLAIRARMGASKTDLALVMEAALAAICGAAKPAAKRTRAKVAIAR